MPPENDDYEMQHLLREQIYGTDSDDSDRELEFDVDEDDEDVDDRTFLQTNLEVDRSVSLWREDAAYMLLDFFQFFGIVLWLAEEEAVWPKEWLDAVFWVFLANLDIWSFKRHQDAFTASARPVRSDQVGLEYATMLYAWLAIPVLLCLGLWGVQRAIRRRASDHAFLQEVHAVRFFAFAAYVLFLPAGITYARSLQCSDNLSSAAGQQIDANLLLVDNSVECWTADHLTLAAPAVLVGGAFLIGLPVVLYHAIRDQVFASGKKRHEGYLQLKETEYVQHVDLVWLFGKFFLFASYQRPWSFYKPLVMVFKILLLFVLVVFYSKKTTMTLLLLLLFGFLTLAILAVPVYRVRSFNPLALILMTVVTVDSLFVFMKIEGVNSAILEAPHITTILLVLNGAALVVALLWFVYLELRQHRVGCFTKQIWPVTFNPSFDNVSDTTKHYMQVIVRARRLLQSARELPQILAPVHELARHIQIVNACSRDSESDRDPIHDTLWDLLDELIEFHNKVARASIYSETTKASTRHTAKRLLALLPKFKQHLDQRDFDFALINRKKRRLLLKMYCVSVFLHPSPRRKAATAAESTSGRDDVSLPIPDEDDDDRSDAGTQAANSGPGAAATAAARRPASSRSLRPTSRSSVRSRERSAFGSFNPFALRGQSRRGNRERTFTSDVDDYDAYLEEIEDMPSLRRD